MNFGVQEAGGRVFFVNTTHGQLWEIGTGQWMDPVVINEERVLEQRQEQELRTSPLFVTNDDEDRAAVVGTATRKIGDRVFFGQFQPEDDMQEIDGEKQGDVDGPGQLQIREVLGVGQYKLVLECAVTSRLIAWGLFDSFVPEPVVE